MSKAKKGKVAKAVGGGGKKLLLILGGITFLASFLVVYLVTLGKSQNTEASARAQINLQPSARGSSGSDEVQPSEAIMERIRRVQEEEAKAAQIRGHSYIPETYLGTPEQIREALDSGELEERITPSYQHYQQASGQAVHDQSLDGLGAAMEEAVLNQVSFIIAQQNTPATVTPVTITYKPREPVQGVIDEQANTLEGSANAKQRSMIINADEIMNAILLTPIDTYKTNFALAEIVGGPFNGAMLRGEVMPMTGSGDVEDVGIRFSSMSLGEVYYPIDAIALNESTATDAMDGKVDRRIFSRYVMPIVAATFSGVGAYFTARGDTGQEYLQDTDGNSVVISKEKANKREARYQAYGDAVDKTAQLVGNAIEREARRPQRVYVAKGTPIGVIFNAPVYQ